MEMTPPPKIQLQVQSQRKNFWKDQHCLQPTWSWASQHNQVPLPAQNSYMGSLARMDLNPRVYLQNEESGKLKYRAIVDYVPHLSHRETNDSDQIDLMGGFSLRSTSRKIKLEQVTVAKWVAANARILGEIGMKDIVGGIEEMQSVVLNYLAYTTKIEELAMGHTWASVLLYDDDYRYSYCQYKFPWGSDSPHLVSTHLVKRTYTKENETRYQKSGENACIRKEGQDRELPTCDYYNDGRNCPHNPCRFQHECQVCGKKHRKIDHPTSAGAASWAAMHGAPKPGSSE